MFVIDLHKGITGENKEYRDRIWNTISKYPIGDQAQYIEEEEEEVDVEEVEYQQFQEFDEDEPSQSTVEESMERMTPTSISPEVTRSTHSTPSPKETYRTKYPSTGRPIPPQVQKGQKHLYKESSMPKHKQPVQSPLLAQKRSGPSQQSGIGIQQKKPKH